MSKRVMIGGVVVLAVALAGFFGRFFGGFGTGEQGGENAKETTAENTALLSNTTARPDDRSPAAQTAAVYLDYRTVGVLEVIVDARSYTIRNDRNGARPVELGELIELAKRTPGNEEGVRVRVFRRESALVTTEKALQSALINAGLPQESIVWEQTLLK